MPEPTPSRLEKLATVLHHLGTANRLLAALTLTAVFAIAKLSPGTDTVGLGGALMLFIGGAVSPGMGLPMLISGGMRTRPSLVGLLTGPRAPTPPIAQGPTIRFFGLLLTLAGGVAIVLGAGLAADGLPRLALEFP